MKNLLNLFYSLLLSFIATFLFYFNLILHLKKVIYMNYCYLITIAIILLFFYLFLIIFIISSSFLILTYLFIYAICSIANSSYKIFVLYAYILWSIMNNLAYIVSWLNDNEIFILQIAYCISIYQLDSIFSIILMPTWRFMRYLLN